MNLHAEPAGAAVQIGALWEQTSKTTGECFLQAGSMIPRWRAAGDQRLPSG
jgi:hypothetical protein